MVDSDLAQQAVNGLWWVKNRDNTNDHQLVDSVRGGNLAITTPNLNDQQAYVAPAGNSVAWCWNYNSANPAENGFEIIQYLGTGATQTINHNLGKKPEWIITQAITGGPTAIPTWHISMGDDQYYARLNNQGGVNTGNTTMWDNIGASSYDVGSDAKVNASGVDNMIAYLWTSIPGYSAFGKYVGNANTSGPFIYTGFRPAWVMCKSTAGTSGGTGWSIWDSTRNISNPANHRLLASNTQSEADYEVDLLSNGFKLRGSNENGVNANNATYIYIAFAENPFGGSNVSPAAAR